MKSIKSRTENTIYIKKSKFITVCIPLYYEEDIKKYIEEMNNKYKDATHVCYGYRFEGGEKCSDNGEPSGTAGLPILNILKQAELQNVICFVIRYFGGIKLGAAGLIRAYAGSVKELIIKSTIIDLTKGFKIKISFSYNQSKKIDYLLQNKQILNKEFNDQIIYIFLIERESFEKIKESLELLSNELIILDSLLLEKN